jgi:hypothetical protein
MPCRRRDRSGDYKHTRKHREVLHTRRVDTLLGTGNPINLDNPENFTTLQNFIGQPKPFGWI